jgi:hypothetical protein
MCVASIQQLIVAWKLSATKSIFMRRSLVIGFGSITPALFGFIIDIINNHQRINSEPNWIIAFLFLDITELIATFCASQFKS